MLAALASTWSACIEAPPDLLLVTKVRVFTLTNIPNLMLLQDGVLGAHCALLLPLSGYLKGLAAAASCCGSVQVLQFKYATCVQVLPY